MQKTYIAQTRLWSELKDVYTEAGEVVDTAHWTPDDIRYALERGDIREAEQRKAED
jgi:hypothetical protein